MCFHLLRGSKHPARYPQTSCHLRWSQTSEAITCTHEVDITVEKISSGPQAFQTDGEVSMISSQTDNSPTAYHASPSPFDASNHRAKADALASAASEISVDTTSTVPDPGNAALNAAYASASTSLAVFAKPSPVHNEGRILPPQIILWLRSRLATGVECTDSTVLTVAWWQPILMRIMSLDCPSSVVNYRLHPSTTNSRCASWWREQSTKNPSADQINRVCGDCQLIYLRTTGVLDVGKLKSSLRNHYLFRRSSIIAMVSFAIDTWEILVKREYVDDMIICAQHCGYDVEKNIRPGHFVKDPSNLRNSFESCMRAREQLVARASLVKVASGNNQLPSCAATVYRGLVKLYRCYVAYNTIVSLLLATDQPLCSPGWSCLIGFFQYPTYEPVTEKRCE